jgi:single-strand DNA-binding protein
MPNYNKVILMGRLTRDPEVKYTSSGAAITDLGIAVNRFWRNQDGQQQEETTFVNVTAFGKQAETVGQYLKKGRPIFIEGYLRMDQWDDKQTGEKRSKLKIVLDRFEFIDSKGDGGGGGAGGGGGYENQSNAPAASSGSSAPAASLPEDDDVPF